MNESLVDAAVAFAAAGCAVVPAKAGGSKAPADFWKQWQLERPSAGQVIAWLTNGGYDGFGVVCGAVSGQLEMLEMEGRAVAAGIPARYMALLADHGLLPVWQRAAAGYSEVTPSGGLHVLYRVNGTARGNTKLARRPATAAELAAKPGDRVKVLIETRGEGGFTITAPSGGATHETGRCWRLIKGGPDTIATISEEERDALHAVASLLDQSPPPPAAGITAAAGGQEGRPGDDYAARVTWREILGPHGWRRTRDFGGGAAGWCRPGKHGSFVSATTRDSGGLYVFSTSTPFETEIPYTKFGAYALLNHDGDHAAAARALRRDGYGGSQSAAEAAAVHGLTGTKEDENTNKEGASFVFSSSFVPVPEPLMYHGLLGEITATVAPHTEADPVGVYASLLAGAGVAIGPTPYVQVGNTRHPLLIWPLLFGRTGSGRKGEATNTAEPFIRTAEPAAAEFIVGGLSSGEGLIERIRDPSGKDEGVTDKRLLVVEAEFGSVMIRSRREGSTLAAVQRQAWDGRALRVLNRKALQASASHVAVIGHVTPQEFRLRLAETEMAAGTYNRYLPLFVERSKLLAIPAGTDERTISELSGRLATAIAAGRRVMQIRLDGDAGALWAGELYPEFGASDDEDQVWTESTRRAAPYCLRIAGLLAVLDGQPLIGKDHLAAAGALVRYSVASAKYVLDRQARDPRLDRIRRAVTMAGGTGMTRTEISALFSRNLRKDLLGELLEQLVQDGSYERTKETTGGRPAETYRRTWHIPQEGTP